MNLSLDEYIEEITKIEENSKFFLKSFSIIWFAIIFLIGSELLRGNTENLFFNNFEDLFIQVNLAKFAVLILLFLFSKLIIQVLFNLSKNISKSRLEFEDKKDAYFSKKKKLKENIFDGFFATILLIICFSLILLINNQEIIEKIEELILIIVSLSLGIYFYLFPLYIVLFRKVLIQRKLYAANQYRIISAYIILSTSFMLLLIISNNILNYIYEFSFITQFYISLAFMILLGIVGITYNNLWNEFVGYKIRNYKVKLIKKLFENY